MPFSGDTNKLRISPELANIARDTADRIRPQLLELLTQGFDSGKDPYGNDWKPLSPETIKRGRFPPPLTDTRAMRNSTLIEPRGADIICHISTPADYHQVGAGPRLPIRQVLPTDAQGLPKTWEAILNKEFTEVLQTRLGKL